MPPDAGRKCVKRGWLAPLLVLASASVAGAPSVQAQPGDVDTTFQFPFPGLFAPDAYNAVPVPGGWLTVRFTLPRSSVEQTTLTLTQIDRDGRVVKDYGSGGSVVQKLPGLVDASAVMRRLPDGKVLLAGFMVGPDDRSLSAVVRLDMNGRIDPAFAGSGGIFTFDVPGDGDQIGALDVLPDGRIVAVVYSRIDPFDYFDCVRDRVTLVTMPNAPGGGPVELLQMRDRDTFNAVACREPISLQVGQDGRILFGSEVGVFRGDAASTEPSIVAGPANGPFASDEKYGLVYSIVDGDGFAIQTTTKPSTDPLHMYRGLGQAAGVPFWSTWNRMAVDATRDVVYVGLAAGEGNVAVARFELPSGELDTGWGGGDGIITLPRVPGSAPYYFYGYGIGTEVRLIDIQPDGAIVVATADGVVARILGGEGVQHGAFSLVGKPDLLERTSQVLQIHVQRLGGASGAVSVDYRVMSPTCMGSDPANCIGSYGSASPGEDFVGAAGTLAWPDGDVSDRVIEVEVRPSSSQVQLPEVFSVKLTNPAGGAGMLVDSTNIYLAGTSASATQSPPPPPPSPASESRADRSGGVGATGAPLTWLLLLTAVAAASRHRRLAPVCCCAIPLVWLPIEARALPGDPDPTFVYPAPAVLEPDSTNLVALSSGWMVVKSRLPALPGTNATLELTRIDEDGARVPDFGDQGLRTITLPGPLNPTTAAARLDNDAMLLGGFQQGSSADDSVPAIVRLDAEGALDTTFGDAGVVLLDVPGQLGRVAELQPLTDGRLAVVVWSKLDDGGTGCWPDRTALWYLSADGKQREEAAWIDRPAPVTGSCRTAVTLLADWDDQDNYRVLWGNQAAINDGAAPYLTEPGNFGPFGFHWYYPSFFTNVEGGALQLLGGPVPAGDYTYPDLGKVAGFDSDSITWTRLVLAGGHLLFAAFSTDGGQVAIARLGEDGHLDTAWGGGDGVAVVAGAGRPAATAPGGLAKDLRLLRQTNRGVIVATSDGVIQRLLRGGDVLVPALQPYFEESFVRARQDVRVAVARNGNLRGRVSVDYVLEGYACFPGRQCAPDVSMAEEGEDFVAQHGTLTWEDGDGLSKLVTIQLLDPPRPQPHEVLAVRFFNPTGDSSVSVERVAMLLQPATDPRPIAPPAFGSSGSGGSGAIGAWTLAMLFLVLLPAAVRRPIRRLARSASEGRST